MTASKNNILRNLMKRKSQKSTKSCEQELRQHKSTAFRPFLLNDHESTDVRRKDDENTKKKYWSSFQSSGRSSRPFMSKASCEDDAEDKTKRNQEQALYVYDQWSDDASIESLSSVDDSDLADRFLIAY